MVIAVDFSIKIVEHALISLDNNFYCRLCLMCDPIHKKGSAWGLKVLNLFFIRFGSLTLPVSKKKILLLLFFNFKLCNLS